MRKVRSINVLLLFLNMITCLTFVKFCCSLLLVLHRCSSLSLGLEFLRQSWSLVLLVNLLNLGLERLSLELIVVLVFSVIPVYCDSLYGEVFGISWIVMIASQSVLHLIYTFCLYWIKYVLFCFFNVCLKHCSLSLTVCFQLYLFHWLLTTGYTASYNLVLKSSAFGDFCCIVLCISRGLVNLSTIFFLHLLSLIDGWSHTKNV